MSASSEKSRRSTTRSPVRAATQVDRVVGIDPGLSGALVFLQGGSIVDYIDMPAVQVGNVTAPFVDGLAVVRFFLDHRPQLIVIEQVASRPVQGVSSTFKFGAAYGAVVALALASPVPVRLSSPVYWKRRAGLLGTEKDAARLKAREMWPSLADTAFRLKKHSGRADAALIAVYGQ